MFFVFNSLQVLKSLISTIKQMQRDERFASYNFANNCKIGTFVQPLLKDLLDTEAYYEKGKEVKLDYLERFVVACNAAYVFYACKELPTFMEQLPTLFKRMARNAKFEVSSRELAKFAKDKAEADAHPLMQAVFDITCNLDVYDALCSKYEDTSSKLLRCLVPAAYALLNKTSGFDYKTQRFIALCSIIEHELYELLQAVTKVDERMDVVSLMLEVFELKLRAEVMRERREKLRLEGSITEDAQYIQGLMFKSKINETWHEICDLTEDLPSEVKSDWLKFLATETNISKYTTCRKEVLIDRIVTVCLELEQPWVAEFNEVSSKLSYFRDVLLCALVLEQPKGCATLPVI